MDTAERIREIRKSTGMNRREFCEYFGIPYRTVSEWENDGRHAPEYVVRLLAYYVKLNLPGNSFSVKDSSRFTSDTEWEAGVNYPEMLQDMPKYDAAEPEFPYVTEAKKEYTIDDWLALPDDVRAELIDGQLIIMETPLIIHQELIAAMHIQLYACMKKHNSPCRLMFSPVGVQLDCDNRTVVEPDLLIVCDREKIRDRTVFGAPDFVVEVLSPSTRKKDMNLKLFKYSNAGVREYWMVDPKDRKVIVHDFEHDELPVIYGFDDTVPVGISEGKCAVDFKEIIGDIDSFYGTE